MFIAIVLSTIGLIFLLSLRDWLSLPRISSKKARAERLKKAAEAIALSQWNEGAEILKPLLDKGLGGKDTLLLHAKILRGTKEYEAALHLLFDAAHYFPEELLFRQEEAKVLLEMGQPKEALEAFKVCAPILRTENDLLEVAEAYLLAKHEGHAWEILESLLPQAKSGKAFALAGRCLFARKEHSQAILYYQRALETGWNTHQVLVELAHAFRKQGNLTEAEHIFRKLLEKDSSDVQATLGLGACMEERGFHQKALLIYQSGKAWEQKDPKILHQASLCALHTKKYHFAEHYFFQIIQALGPTAELLSYYGYTLEKQKKWQVAEQNYLQQIELFPSDAGGYRALAWMFGVGLSTLTSPKEGLHYAHVGLKLLPDVISWEILSACEARVGNFSKAHKIQEYLIKHPPTLEARSRYSHAMRKLRKQEPLSDALVLRSRVA